jgi:glucose/arabinose dehydrogenase
LRNPYGLAFDSNNKLIVSVDGADERGSRPIANDEDKVYSIDVLNSTRNSSKFYGWPDYFGNGEPVISEKFQSNSSSQPLQFLMQNHPPVEKPLSLVGHNVSITQMTMSNNSNFGFKGNMFIGEFGPIWYSTFGSIGVPSPTASTTEQQSLAQQQSLASNTTTTTTVRTPMAPNMIAANNTSVGNNDQTARPTGQKLMVFDPTRGNYSDFLSLKNPDPNFHPVDAEFSHDGSSLYVVSVGKVEMRKATPQGHELIGPMPWFYQNTGILWRITNTTTVEQGPAAENEIRPEEIHLMPDLKKTINSGSPPDTSYLDIQDGYNIQPILWDVDKPGSMAFDDKGNMYFASVGITYGKQSTTPAIYKIDANGTLSLFMDRPLHGTLADIEFNRENGKLYVAHRNLLSAIDIGTTGVMQDLVVGIPTSPYVTHPMGQIAFGPDGRIYFGVGGLSNTAVPDISDYGIGFIAEMPFMHEVPPHNITLEGINFQSDNFLTAEFTDSVITGGFRPFGVPAYAGQIIEGHPLCTSCIWSINPNGSDFKVEAWGARNPFGMAFDDKGRLFWSNNGNDDKGIRRVTADVDTVSVLDVNQDNITFFGWPDIIGMGEPIDLDKFNQSPNQNYTDVPLIKDPPPATPPLVDLGGAVAASQLAYSTSDEFGSKGKMFLAEFGTSAPIQHIHQIPKERSPGSVMGQMLGQRVVVIDTESGNFGDFISLNAPESSFRPVGLQFSPDGSSLYIASIEDHVIRKVTPTGAILDSHHEWPYALTGVIYKVWKEDSSSSSSPQQISTAAAIGEENQANSTNTTTTITNATVPRKEEGQ